MADYQFVLTIFDGERNKLRAFQTFAFTPEERALISRIIECRMDYVRALESPLESVFGAENTARYSEVMPLEVQAGEHSTPPTQASIEQQRHTKTTETLTQREIAQQMGFSGNVCEQCGSMELVRTGTCETCKVCGWNKGCG